MMRLTEGCGYVTSVAIGGMPIDIRSASLDFIRMIENRYDGFVAEPVNAGIRFDIDVVQASSANQDEDLRVSYVADRWIISRGDFRAEWDPVANLARIRQAAYPYAVDSLLRIVHSLVLAERGGFLVHSASAVRNGRGFLFSGVSGAGKTTISRLAPRDVRLLTDEISYVCRSGDDYQAYGTPFFGELGSPGENITAPIVALYLLTHGPEDRAEALLPSLSVQRLLRNILFFANDASLVERVFRSACEFVSKVPVYELTFRPDGEVWNLIR
jgi:hypothetical protein